MTTLAKTSQSANADSQHLRLSALLRAARRHSVLIVVCGLVGAVLGLSYAHTLSPYFTASSLIAIEGDRFAIPELQGALRSDNTADPMPMVRTEMQALTSPDLMRQVVERLDLADLPEFNAELQPPSVWKSIKTELWGRTTMPPTRSDIEASVVNAVLRSLSLFQDNRSLAIEISFSSQDAQRSADVINTLIAAYVRSRAERRLAVNRDANAAMMQRIGHLRQDIADFETRIEDLRNRNGLVLLRAGGVGQQQLEELTTAAARAAVERADLESSYDRASALARQGNSDALAGVLGSPTISQLRQQEAAASQRVAELSARYGEKYPGVASAHAQLSSARRLLAGETQRIVASVGSQLNVARQREAALNQQLDEARKTALQSENARAELDQLQQEVTSRRALYQTLMERAQQTVEQKLPDVTPDVHVISTATAPLAPSGPNLRLAGGLGGMGGVLLGCLVMLARVRSVDAFANPDVFEAETGITVLSRLPQNTLRRGRRNLLERVRGDTAEVQAIRSIRNRLRQMGRSKLPRIVMLSAATAVDHAALLAIALSRVAAADGEAVLVIECDPQHRHLARVLNLRVGTARLSGGPAQDWRDLLVGDPDAPVDLLIPPPTMLNDWPHGTLFQNLIVEVPQDYDLVLLVAPQASSADTLAIAQRADVSLLVLAAGEAPGVMRGLAERYVWAARGALGAVLFGRMKLGHIDGARP